MHIKSLRATGFRRFADLTIEISGSPRLVVVCGPNGSGKSAVFDAMRVWHGQRDSRGFNNDPSYLLRPGADGLTRWDQVAVEFHEAEEVEPGSDLAKKAFYLRTAYRNDPEFASNQITRTGPIMQAPVTQRMIDNDARVSENYARLVGRSLEDLFSGEYDEATAGELSERYIGPLRVAVTRLFPDLRLT